MAAYAALVSLSQTTHLNRTQDRFLFSSDAEGKITSIHEYAVYLQSFFKNFPEKTKRWEGRIRDVAHETQDFIEDFLWLRIQPRHERRVLPNLEDQLKNAMEKIGLIVGEVMEERPAYLPPSSSSSRLAAATANDTVIGLEDDVATIWHRLCGEPSSNLQVIPIVGMAGIGKTTLTTTLYNHASLISGHFDFRAWITLSQDYNSAHSLRKILLGLLEKMNLLEELVLGKKLDELFDQVDEKEREDLYKKVEKVDVSEMATKVFQYLKYRRYLVVLDDVWSTEVWDDLMKIFPDDGNGSRIMVTTRMLEVAAYPDSESPLHEMQVMNDAQSWNLLKQKVFTNGDCPHDLEDVGEEIAKSCAGLPLTVVLVAGLLSTVNNTRASWEDIAKNVNSVVGKELEGILSLSYTHLPHHLRPCFLYLGGFPEDEKIRAATLIKLWVAEGFVKHEDGCSKIMEEEAEEYLEDFVKRNLVIVNSRKIDGKIKSCSLHDMVRDLCMRKGHEEKFLRVMDGRVDSQEMMDERRISLMLSDMNSLWVPTTRTILSFNLNYMSNLLVFLQRFRLLRVWHGARVSRNVLCPQVFELFHLRYLALKGWLRIPSAISNLVNLQTLIIFPTFRRKKIKWRDYLKYTYVFVFPLEIWRLLQLRHLVFHDSYILPHPPLGAKSNLPLVNLQTLSLIENLVWNEKMVEMIPNVKRLGLVYTIDREYHLHHLKKLLQLEKLKVILSWKFFWQGRNPSFPRTLKKLSLVGGGFPWADMSIIGSLPNLQVLKLRDHACVGETWETGDDEFPQLKYLLIETSCLRQWITESSPFPVLQRLVLGSCWFLREIPVEIGEISTLEMIQVGDCRKSILTSAIHIEIFRRREGDDAFQFHFVRPSSSCPDHKVHEEQDEQRSDRELCRELNAAMNELEL